MPEDWSNEHLQMLSDKFVSRDKYEGHPSSGGLPMLIAWATQEELAAALHAVPGAVYAEIDSPLQATEDKIFNERTTSETLGGRSCSQDHEPLGHGLPWGLDRLDSQADLDGKYIASGPDGGRGVHVYVMDTGIRTSHAQFGGRAIPTLEALEQSRIIACQAMDVACAADKNGHGTRIASVVGGSTVGVAEGAWLHAVKIMNDKGMGSIASFIIAADWILVNHEKPAVLMAALNGTQDAGASRALKDAMDKAVAAGIPVIVPAGDDDTNACMKSPSYVPSALTVGAVNVNMEVPAFSNYGKCVDLFAPGSEITTASIANDSAYDVVSSTSVAAAHAAGAAAVLLSTWSSLNASEVHDQLVISSYKNALKDSKSSANKLLGISWTAMQTVTIGPGDSSAGGVGKSRKVCVKAPYANAGELHCARNAGDYGHRLGKDRFKDTFNITVEGDQVCATRTDNIEDDFLPGRTHSSACMEDDGGWTLNLQVLCHVRHVERMDSWLFGSMGPAGDPSVCAGTDFRDRKSLYYSEYDGVGDTAECMALCKAQYGCKGFSMADNGKCEVWLKSIESVARPPQNHSQTSEISCNLFLGRGTPGSGIIRLASSPNMCLEAKPDKTLAVAKCDTSNEKEQFSWAGVGQFHMGKGSKSTECLIAHDNSTLTHGQCAEEQADQIFSFQGTGLIYWSGDKKGDCIVASYLTPGSRVGLAKCDKTNPNMQFFY